MDFSEFMQAKNEIQPARESRTKPMIEALKARPNQPFSIKEIAQEAGLKESTIKSALATLKKEGKVLRKRINGLEWVVYVGEATKQEEKPHAPIREHTESDPQRIREEPLEDNPGSP